jgi:1-acyl-sn-glycerol-3-phosphate acyltransferase
MARRVLGDNPFDSKVPKSNPPSSDAPKAEKKSVDLSAKSAAKPRKSVATKAPGRSKSLPPERPSEHVTVHEATVAVHAIDTVNVEDKIRELEAQLQQLRNVPKPAQSHHEGEATEGEHDGASSLLQSDFYLRQWGRLAMRDRSEAVDEFGLDPVYARKWSGLLDFLYDRWWRVDVSGIENLPTDGRFVLVANHSGALPYDGMMLAKMIERECPGSKPLRWLAEDFVFQLPFVGAHLTRLGAVRACQENAERLLRRDVPVAVFPEGVKGISKLFRERYRLQRFGRGGHIKLAMRMRTPLVPVSILGAEETHPLLATGGPLARVFGMPYFPVTPTFPALGALGAVPLPTKWKIVIGEPLEMDSYNASSPDDEVLVGRLNEKIRTTVQDTLDSMLRQRKSVFSG